jgi:rod shape determining protein RodA
MVLVVFLIVGIGMLFIYSGTYGLFYDGGINFVQKQLVWVAVGLALAAFCTVLDYRKLAHFSAFLYVFFIVLLAVVLFTSDPRRGAKSWFFFGFVALQPSEFAKIAIVLLLAHYLSNDYFPRRSRRYFLGAVMVVALPLFLILKQPDLGTAIVLVPVLLAMLIVARARTRYLVYLLIIGTCALPLCWSLLKPYQQSRIKVFLNPQLDPLRSGYNAIQSQIAVGSGGFSGQGWLHGTQTHLRFLPERHTDFIFCIIGEETGFLGAFLLIGLYMILLARGFLIAEQSRDEYGSLLGVGLTMLIAAHVAINIGMTVGLLPITGIPLPLMSYGGSSMLSTLIALGILQSIRVRRYVF